MLSPGEPLPKMPGCLLARHGPGYMLFSAGLCPDVLDMWLLQGALKDSLLQLVVLQEQLRVTACGPLQTILLQNIAWKCINTLCRADDQGLSTQVHSQGLHFAVL